MSFVLENTQRPESCVETAPTTDGGAANTVNCTGPWANWTCGVICPRLEHIRVADAKISEKPITLGTALATLLETTKTLLDERRISSSDAINLFRR